MNIGIMGGTFDPIHMGHLVAAERAREAVKLDEVWFMPCHVPPHKDQPPKASAKHRMDMVRLAVSDHPCFKVYDGELRRGGVSYTYDTMKILRHDYPEDCFHIIIGGDMVQYLPHWHRIQELLQMARFIGLKRPGTTIDFAKLGEEIASKVTLVPMPQLDISSSQIREWVKNSQSIRYLVPDPVFRYIKENRLYES